MQIKEFYKKIPILPLSAIIFYLVVLILWNFEVIPSSSDTIDFLEGLYESYGYVGLFIASFLEGLVYVGIYFAGSFIILIFILFSDGSFLTLLSISIVIALALTIVSVVNYVLGRHIVLRPLREDKEVKEKRKISKGLILSSLHPNALAFYFFNLGLNKKNPWTIVFVPLIMIPYGFLVALLFYQIKPFLERNAENPYVLITILLIWLIIAFILKNRKK